MYIMYEINSSTYNICMINYSTTLRGTIYCIFNLHLETLNTSNFLDLISSVSYFSLFSTFQISMSQFGVAKTVRSFNIISAILCIFLSHDTSNNNRKFETRPFQ